MQQSFVNIKTNKYRITFYIGVTSSLSKRILEHALGEGSKFTKKYSLVDLVYFEEFTDINRAISREKHLKNCHLDWKLNFIKQKNPTIQTLDY
ncbi:GIY-YIG nuclease family protein [uncultured Maribacter sp.]|uniref:GIY-YIG nuclease family protein n=1 Tax=uncultured Maribacter sp. TaxID=431308 RepID=UPI0030D71655|tara:strand:+ start:202 stop:480 length:279 start_codon:yes stop_codon:yes gene_type:complete